MGGAWLSLHLWDHYDFTRDTQVPSQPRAIPMMKEAATFLLDFAFEHDGQLMIGPTISPENAYLHDGARGRCA